MSFLLGEVMQHVFVQLSTNTDITDIVGYNDEKQVPNIYNGIAISGHSYPLVVFDFVSPRYKRYQGGPTLALSGYVDILAHDNTGDLTSLMLLSQCIEESLQLSVQDTTPVIMGFSAQAPISRVFYDDGKTIDVAGTRFEFWARSQS